MLSYLHASGLHETYESLRRETDTDDFDPSDGKAKWVGLLEKKWTSVIRLQKKVCLTCHGWRVDRVREAGYMTEETKTKKRVEGKERTGNDSQILRDMKSKLRTTRLTNR